MLNTERQGAGPHGAAHEIGRRCARFQQEGD